MMLVALIGLIYYDISNHSCGEDHSNHDCDTDDNHIGIFDEIIHYVVHILVCVIFCTLFHNPIHRFLNWIKNLIGIKQRENCSH